MRQVGLSGNPALGLGGPRAKIFAGAAGAAVLGLLLGGLPGSPVGKAHAAGAACTLIVPDKPLTAAGLATPYQLLATNANNGPCDEANPAQSAFVEAAILDPVNGRLFKYNPVVVNAGQAPAIAPTIPQLPANAIVSLFFGFQGDVLTLTGATPQTLNQAGCINGVADAPFGQLAYCNAQAFYAAANQQIAGGNLLVQAPAMALDGLTCPTSRDYLAINQNQGSGVGTTYLLTGNGAIAPDTAANRTLLGAAKVMANGAGNSRVLNATLSTAMNCPSALVPDMGDAGNLKPALFANELQAMQFQNAPVALVPSNSPMTLLNGRADVTKTNLYRAALGQPQLAAAGAEQKQYCADFRTTTTTRMVTDQVIFSNAASQDPAVANNLFTFMATRANTTWNTLNCTALTNMNPPFALTVVNNVTTAAQVMAAGGT